MAVAPEIALGYHPANAAGSGLEMLGSMAGTMEKWAGIQNALNQNRLFQQTQAARARAGEIISASPDLDSAIHGLTQDPLVAPYAAETINTLRQSQLAFIQGQGALQEQADKGLQAVMKSMPEVMADPSRWNEIVGARLATLNPAIRNRVKVAVDSLQDSLTHDLPDDPQQRQVVFSQRLAGKVLGAGFTPEAIQGIVGTPTTVKTGAFQEFGITLPPQLGGGFAPQGALQEQLAPQIASGPGGVPIQAGGASLPPSVVPVPRGQSALGTSPAQSSDKAQSAITGSSDELSGTGKPLLFGEMASPKAGVGLAGLPILSPAQLKQAEKLQDEFSSDGLKEYQNAVNSMASLTYMNNALDEMAKGGGFLIPGSGANFRTEIAKGINTMAQVAGMKPLFDPSKIASIEEFNKETKRMGLMVINQMLGGQREAAQIILGITSSVPGVENTYLGGKLVAKGLEAAAHRAIDMRNFQNEWQARNQGNLSGSAEAFNKRFPADEYAKSVLAEMGLTARGFASPQAKAEAQRLGYLASPEVTASPKTRRPLSEIIGAP